MIGEHIYVSFDQDSGEGWYEVEYSFEGEKYGIEMWAANREDLQKRLSALVLTHEVFGQKVFQIQVPPRNNFKRYGTLKYLWKKLKKRWGITK